MAAFILHAIDAPRIAGLSVMSEGVGMANGLVIWEVAVDADGKQLSLLSRIFQRVDALGVSVSNHGLELSSGERPHPAIRVKIAPKDAIPRLTAQHFLPFKRFTGKTEIRVANLPDDFRFLCYLPNFKNIHFMGDADALVRLLPVLSVSSLLGQPCYNPLKMNVFWVVPSTWALAQISEMKGQVKDMLMNVVFLGVKVPNVLLGNTSILLINCMDD